MAEDDPMRPLLAESDLIDFYKRRMAEHRNDAIINRKRAEKAEAEAERLKKLLEKVDTLANR